MMVTSACCFASGALRCCCVRAAACDAAVTRIWVLFVVPSKGWTVIFDRVYTCNIYHLTWYTYQRLHAATVSALLPGIQFLVCLYILFCIFLLFVFTWLMPLLISEVYQLVHQSLMVFTFSTAN